MTFEGWRGEVWAAGLWQPELASIALIAATLASCSAPSSPCSISVLAAVCGAWEEAAALLPAAVSSFSLLTAIWARKSGPPAAGPAGDGGSGVAVEDDTVPLPGDGGTISSGGPACMIAPSGPGVDELTEPSDDEDDEEDEEDDDGDGVGCSGGGGSSGTFP
uniref:Secreted protein n=1 Tax=Anopheles melas TaxID=34690 RepID=A0A182UC49_9DIPT